MVGVCTLSGIKATSTQQKRGIFRLTKESKVRFPHSFVPKGRGIYPCAIKNTPNGVGGYIFCNE